jgi:uncharacterized DUF497 family protein
MIMRFSEHAKERMVERNISEAEIFGMFADTKIVFAVSKKNASRMIATGKTGKKMLTAVFDPVSEDIVTVRSASKKERRAYGEK